MAPVPVAWSNDDIGHGDAPRLARMLAFLDRHDIPGTFFLIPRSRSGDLDQDRGLLALIEQARGRGHEFHQHGCRHTAFECGIPELEMLAWSAEESERFEREREAIEAAHAYPALVRMLEDGRRVWRRAFAAEPQGFRPGWGAWCGALYQACADLGYAWVSARIPCMTSWNRQRGRWDEALRFRPGIPAAPLRVPQGIRELPMGGDVAFRVPPARVAEMVRLGQEEHAHHAAHGSPFVLVSHWHGLEHEGGTGYAVHEQLLPWLQAGDRSRFVGMSALAAAA